MPRHPLIKNNNWTGGPFKPAFGLSGAVQLQYKVFQLLSRVSAPSIPTQSLRAPQPQLRSDESCSTPSPPDARISRPSPDCDECNAASPQTAHNCEH